MIKLEKTEKSTQPRSIGAEAIISSNLKIPFEENDGFLGKKTLSIVKTGLSEQTQMRRTFLANGGLKRQFSTFFRLNMIYSCQLAFHPFVYYTTSVKWIEVSFLYYLGTDDRVRDSKFYPFNVYSALLRYHSEKESLNDLY